MTLILLLLLDALHPWGHSSLIVSHGKRHLDSHQPLRFISQLVENAG